MMMQMLRKIIISLLLFFLFSLTLCACTKKPEKFDPPRLLGTVPISSVISVNNYHDVLSEWTKRGYRNMTVVHVGPLDGLAYIPAERMKAIKTRLKAGTGESEAGLKATYRDYLFAASRLGLIKRIYWIIPFNHLNFIDAERRIRHFLETETSHFRPKDVEAMRINNGCVSGSLFNIETHICSLATMPYLPEPVLMTMDMGFFPVFSVTKGINKLGAMKEFFDVMAAKQLQVQALHVVSLPSLKAMHGYLSEQALTLLKEPDLHGKGNPLGLWTARDSADNMLSGGGAKEAASFLKDRIREYPEDPYLILMSATARALLRDKATALDSMSGLCATKPKFCRGLADVGVALRNWGDMAGATEFFQKALELRPGLDSARLEFALTLYVDGKYAEAASALSGISNPDYIVASVLLRGDCAYSMKKENEALRFYEKALSDYQEAGGYRLGNLEKESLNRLKTIYEKRNDQKGLKLLSRMPWID